MSGPRSYPVALDGEVETLCLYGDTTWSHATRVGWLSEGGVIATVVVCAPVGCHEVDHGEERWYGLDGDLIEAIPIEGDRLD